MKRNVEMAFKGNEKMKYRNETLLETNLIRRRLIKHLAIYGT